MMPPRSFHKWPAPRPDASSAEAAPAHSSFLLRHGARRLHPLTPRVRDEDPASHEPASPRPTPREEPEPTLREAKEPDARRLQWEEERALGQWKPLAIEPEDLSQARAWRSGALRFAASCDVGREVAWLRDAQNQPIPLRLAQIGGIALRASTQHFIARGRELRRPWARIERVVALAADRFEWDQVEEWSALLSGHGFRLLIVPPETQPEPIAGAPDAHWKLSQSALAARLRTLEEALRLEREAIRASPDAHEPIILSGPLAARRGSFEPLRPAIAVCRPSPLLPPRITPEWQPDAGHGEEEDDEEASIPRIIWRTLYELRPGQRTPAWICDEAACPLACWFVRLHAPASSNGDSPLSGVVRVEVRRELWAAQASGRAFAGGVSRLLLDLQAREAGRLWPSVRAGQHLRSMLWPDAALEARFGRVCGL